MSIRRGIIQSGLTQPHYLRTQPMPSQQILSELAPTGVLRAAINMGNFLLVTGRTPSGDPEGVAPDMAREIAARLGVRVRYVPYARPGELADAAGSGMWDIGLIGAEPPARRKNRLYARLCRDRGDLPGARRLAFVDHRRCRSRRCADRGERTQRL